MVCRQVKPISPRIAQPTNHRLSLYGSLIITLELASLSRAKNILADGTFSPLVLSLFSSHARDIPVYVLVRTCILLLHGQWKEFLNPGASLTLLPSFVLVRSSFINVIRFALNPCNETVPMASSLFV